MNDSIEKLLARTKYMTLATVCENGRPWSVPITYAYADGCLYWRSHEDTVHSSNIERNEYVSINIFDAEPVRDSQERQALYVQSFASKVAPDMQAVLLEKFGGIFSIKDAQTPLYKAPIGTIDQARSTDNRFYMTHIQQPGETQ